jgi:hypothetical protein
MSANDASGAMAIPLGSENPAYGNETASVRRSMRATLLPPLLTTSANDSFGAMAM